MLQPLLFNKRHWALEAQVFRGQRGDGLSVRGFGSLWDDRRGIEDVAEDGLVVEDGRIRRGLVSTEEPLDVFCAEVPRIKD